MDPDGHSITLRDGVGTVDYLEVIFDDGDGPHEGGGYLQDVPSGLTFVDEDGGEVALDADEARALFVLTRGLENATISACPDCRSRVVAAVAFVDVLDDAYVLARSRELIEFAEDAPTLHLYVIDDVDCDHDRWRDPLYDEWFEVVAASGPHALA